MKNILFALFWAASLTSVFAQRTLPISLQPQMTNCDLAATDVLKRGGFELSTGPAGTSISVRQRSGALQLDSTKTFYGYGLASPSDSTPLFRTIYQYPQPNVKVESEFQYENDAWLTLSRATTHSDAQGRVLEVFGEAFDPVVEAFAPDSRLEAFPHGNSPTLLDSFFVYQWDTDISDWRLLLFSKNYFDDQDRLQESVSSFDYFGSLLIFKDRYTYDANGDNTLIETIGVIDGVEFPTGHRVLEYENKLPTQVVAYVLDDTGQDFPQDKITYDYWPSGQEKQVNTYSWDVEKSDWAQTQGDAYTYDNAQRLHSKETTRYNEDGIEERELAVFAYLEGDNLALEARSFWDGNEYQLSDRKFYYYSDGTLSTGKPTPSTLPLVISPNPTTDAARLNLDGTAWVRIYNANGQLMSSGEHQPGHALSLSDLPSGLYFVTALSADELYCGRLVKE